MCKNNKNIENVKNILACLLFLCLTEEDPRGKVALIIGCTKYNNLEPNLDKIEKSIENLDHALDDAGWEGKVSDNVRSCLNWKNYL